MRTKGFTLVDLLVSIACVAVLILIPACMSESGQDEEKDKDQGLVDAARLMKCKANLRAVGLAIASASAEYPNARFPLLFSTGNPEADVKSTHAARNIESLRTNLAGSEAAMQNVWVMIDKGFITEELFICPADKDAKPREFDDSIQRSKRKVGWWSPSQFSYGLHFPYKSTMVDGKKVDNPAYLGPMLKGSFVVMADKNPSLNNEPAIGVGPRKPPSNHGDLGTRYRSYRAAARQKKDPTASDVNGDDIYTINPQNNKNAATPADTEDQYIVRHPRALE